MSRPDGALADHPPGPRPPEANDTDAGSAGPADPAALDELRAGLARRRWWRRTLLLVGTAVVLAIGVIEVLVGAAGLSAGDVVRAVTGRLPVLGGLVEPGPARTADIVWQLRLPRVAMAAAGGAALALSGAVMQGLLRNPLVSPFTLGISSAAAFGASIAIVFGASSAGGGDALIVGGALGCALLCAALAFGLSWAGRLSASSLILVGIALSYLFAALTATLQLVASNEQLAAIVRWTFGSVEGARWPQVAVVAGTLAVSAPVLLRWARAFDAISFAGEEPARTLGVDVARVRVVACGLSVVMAAVVVSYCGVIAFVGLVAPHVARLLVGSAHRLLLPCSALIGAALLMAADAVGRSIAPPAVVPVGIVVSYLGVPLFLQLIIARRRELAA